MDAWFRIGSSSGEWLLFLLVVSGVVVATRRLWLSSRRAAWVVVALLVLPSLWLAFVWTPGSAPLATLRSPQQTRDQGYVSSDTCRACHAAQYESWHASYHRSMTQVATPEAIAAPARNVSLEGGNRRFDVRFEDGSMWIDDVAQWRAYWHLKRQATPLPADFPRVQGPVVMTTGSHHMQIYWLRTENGSLQHASWTWLIRDQRWVPGEALYLQPPMGPAGLSGVWERNCIKCHSTGGQPRVALGSPAPDPQVGELGIACEACHGPAAQHVAANASVLRRYGHHLDDRPDDTIVNPRRLASTTASEICASCHSGRLHQVYDPNTGAAYRPGDRLEDYFRLRRFEELEPQAQPDYFWGDGTSRVTGREYTGMIESGCFTRGEISCLSCHSMHASDPNDQLAEGMDGDRACLQCHRDERYADPSHTHHPPSSSGARCMNCHMPNTTYGLLMLTRSHRIDSPSAAASARTGRPNACNLCHVDESLAWTDRHLADWSGRPPARFSQDQQTLPASLLWLLEGDAVQRATAAWHLGWGPARDVAGQAWQPEVLLQTLDDPYASVRYLGEKSLRAFAGFEDFDYDFTRPAQAQRDAVARARARVAPGAALAAGVAGPGDIERLRAQRVDPPRRIRE